MHRQQCSTHQEKCEKERDTHIISNYVDSGKIIFDVGGSLGRWGSSDDGVPRTLGSLRGWGPLDIGVLWTSGFLEGRGLSNVGGLLDMVIT